MEEVVPKRKEMCTCSCHETGSCDGHPVICSKCKSFTKIDFIYMTRRQTEREPKPVEEKGDKK